MIKLLVRDVNGLRVAARAILAASPARVILFYGAMGAGKTTLIKAISAELGIGEQVSSPTFSIVNEYFDGKDPVYHFDFYRIKNEAEALDLGIEDYLWSGHYCLIEWPEKIGSLLPGNYLKIGITVNTNGSRNLEATIINS